MNKNVKSIKGKRKTASNGEIVKDVETSIISKTKPKTFKPKVIPSSDTKLKDSDSSHFNEISMKNEINSNLEGESDVNMITPEDFSIIGRSSKIKKRPSSDHQVNVSVKKSKKSKLEHHSENIEVDAKKVNIVMESSQKNKLKYLNDEEAEVKDEDIDEFCDDLDEEANSQYENWVKLIEAKLHSKKK